MCCVVALLKIFEKKLNSANEAKLVTMSLKVIIKYKHNLNKILNVKKMRSLARPCLFKFALFFLLWVLNKKCSLI